MKHVNKRCLIWCKHLVLYQCFLSGAIFRIFHLLKDFQIFWLHSFLLVFLQLGNTFTFKGFCKAPPNKQTLKVS